MINIKIREVKIKNTGTREGKQVVQLYISPRKPSVVRPRKELKAFKKISLQVGEEQEISFELTESMFRYFDADKHEWVTDNSPRDIYIGSESDNTPIQNK